MPHLHTITTTMSTKSERERKTALAKKIHQVTHAPKEEMNSMLRDAGMENQKLFNQYDANYDSCNNCASTRRP